MPLASAPEFSPAASVAPSAAAEVAPRADNLETKVSERLALAHLLSRRLMQVPTDVGTRQALAAMLLSEINIAYYQRLTHDVRLAISQRTYADFCERTRNEWSRGDIPPR